MKTNTRPTGRPERFPDTLRDEYDFSGAARGVTAKRYAEGANVVVIPPDLLDVFPDAASVNDALRALAAILRSRQGVTPSPQVTKGP